jgi:hypothetical protein
MSKSSVKRKTLAETLRTAIEKSGETVGAIARGSGVPRPVLHRFAHGERGNLTLATAEKLCAYLDLELRAAK